MMDPSEIASPSAAPLPDEATPPPAAIPPERTVQRIRRLLLAPVLAGLLAGGIVSQVSTPRYQSQARLWTDSRSFAAGRDSLKVLSSRDFARHVIERNGLTARLAAPLGGVTAALSGAALRVAGFSAVPSAGQESRQTLALRSVERGLSVRDIGSGQIAVDFASPDPRLSADVANAFATNYLELRESRGPFSMDPNAAAPMPARILASAAPAATPRWPTPLISSLTAGIGTFLLVMGFQALARRRTRAAGQEFGAVPMPEVPARAMQHLPWIGGANDEPDEERLPPRGLPARERELADLSRLVEVRGAAARLVVVTGPSPDEGIARCAVALGRALSSTADRRVVLVCLEMSSPTLDALAGDPRAPGLTDLLFGVASFSDAIHRENGSRCHVIPPGRGAREAAGLIAADRLPLILTALTQTYDHVIVAAPPLGGAEGAARIAALAPTTILVTRPGALATDAVQAFDGLGAQGFGDIAMVTFTPETPAGALSRAA
ncbi:lipopolysaccharide biosynthesis protein [Starkeya koreensis]|uniref:Lipopolysaccharide biosynthesis protein n=1 Tax=Ancylobacter koreensis TaxID=266121 RepID=A0ABT0DMT1_9HYPH|nr:lipopolysaccharide biosynthesis protein [Ancylobacter koreensis]MCK0208586.1 lipopolysaccharide biosynthesis protein [Ancylobacter koreensis]